MFNHRISGLVTGLAASSRPSDHHRAPGNCKDAQPHTAALLLAAPKLAGLNPRGNRWFSIGQLRSTGNRGSGKAAPRAESDEHGGVPGLSMRQGPQHKVVEHIPKNAPGERLIQPDKIYKHRVVEAGPQPSPLPSLAAPPAAQQEGTSQDQLFITKRAIKEGDTFMLRLQRQLQPVNASFVINRPNWG